MRIFHRGFNQGGYVKLSATKTNFLTKIAVASFVLKMKRDSSKCFTVHFEDPQTAFSGTL